MSVFKRIMIAIGCLACSMITSFIGIAVGYIIMCEWFDCGFAESDADILLTVWLFVTPVIGAVVAYFKGFNTGKIVHLILNIILYVITVIVGISTGDLSIAFAIIPGIIVVFALIGMFSSDSVEGVLVFFKK